MECHENSLCFLLNSTRVICSSATSSHRFPLDYQPEDVISSRVSLHGERNNLALGPLHFRHVPSQLMDTVSSSDPRVGDVCVRFMPATPECGQYCAIVDLYNANIANPSTMTAKKVISAYAGIEELYIPSIPIHLLVSEWNKSLVRFHEMIKCNDSSLSTQSLQVRREAVMRNVTELAYKNVPVTGEHLWFAIHCIVSKPHLVKDVLQLVGSIGSVLGDMCNTGEVQATTVPRYMEVTSVVKLYLVAKSSSLGKDTVLREHGGVTLTLVWALDEDELLYDHLGNSGKCYYVHIGTEHGNTFRCNGFWHWRYYDHVTFQTMIAIADDTVSLSGNTMLSGNTGDSARMLTATC